MVSTPSQQDINQNLQVIISEHCRHVFSYFTELSLIDNQVPVPSAPGESWKMWSKEKKSYIPIPIKYKNKRSWSYTEKTIREQAKMVKDVIMLRIGVYITISDITIQLWNFNFNEDTMITESPEPAPIELSAGNIFETINIHNYLYLLTKWNEDSFAVFLKENKLIVIFELDSNMEVTYSILNNKEDLVKIMPWEDGTLSTCSRDGIINWWDIQQKKCIKIWKDKTKNYNISFAYKLNNKYILFSDWKAQLTLICNIKTNKMCKKISNDVHGIIQVDHRLFIWICKNIFIHIDTLHMVTLRETSMEKNESIGNDTRFFNTWSTQNYIYFSQSKGKLYLKEVVNKANSTWIKKHFNKNLSNIRILNEPEIPYYDDSECIIDNTLASDTIPPWIILFYNRQFLILDQNVSGFHLVKDNILNINHMFTYHHNWFFITAEEGNSNNNQGIHLYKYKTNQELLQVDYNDVISYKWKHIQNEDYLILWAFNSMRVIAWNTNSLVKEYVPWFDNANPKTTARNDTNCQMEGDLFTQISVT